MNEGSLLQRLGSLTGQICHFLPRLHELLQSLLFAHNIACALPHSIQLYIKESLIITRIRFGENYLLPIKFPTTLSEIAILIITVTSVTWTLQLKDTISFYAHIVILTQAVSKILHPPLSSSLLFLSDNARAPH